MEVSAGCQERILGVNSEMAVGYGATSSLHLLGGFRSGLLLSPQYMQGRYHGPG